MAHARKQIRDAIVAALTGLSTTADRVHAGRTFPLGQDHAPTLLVYAVRERSSVDAMASGGSSAILVRDLELAIEGRVMMAGVPDDLLETIAAEVETAMMADPSLGGLTREITLLSTTINTQSPGQSHAGEVRLDYRVVYRTRENAPQAAV